MASEVSEKGKSATPKQVVEDQEEQAKGGKLILDEERLTGAVSWKTCMSYLRAVDSWWMVAFYAAVQIGSQAAQVGNTLMLGYWSGEEIAGFSMGEYMAVYAGQYLISGQLR